MSTINYLYIGAGLIAVFTLLAVCLAVVDLVRERKKGQSEPRKAKRQKEAQQSPSSAEKRGRDQKDRTDSGIGAARPRKRSSAEHECYVCGKEIKSSKQKSGGKVGKVGWDAFLEEIQNSGRRCSACGLEVCQPCSQEAASAAGKQEYICPKCKGSIAGNSHLI